MSYAPIALFIYKRPEHTQRALESLMQCAEFADSPLYIFCDGSKNPTDQTKVQRTREIAFSLVGTRAKFIESQTNKGLANSIISGVSQLCSNYGRAITLEDDLVVAPEFLNFMNRALDKYEDDEQVMQVSGYMFPIPEFLTRNEALFLPLTTSWGWGTWKRAWNCFDPQASGWEVLETDRSLRKRFNFDGAFDYSNMLKSQMHGQVDSWSIRWHWSVFKSNGLVLFPPQSYVQNIGFDGSGTHGWRSARSVLNASDTLQTSNQVSLPTIIGVTQEDFNLIKKPLTALKGRFTWLKSLVREFTK